MKTNEISGKSDFNRFINFSTAIFICTRTVLSWMDRILATSLVLNPSSRIIKNIRRHFSGSSSIARLKSSRISCDSNIPSGIPFCVLLPWRERGLQGGRVRRVLFYLEIKSTLKRDRQYRYLLVYNGTQRSASSYFKKQ